MYVYAEARPKKTCIVLYEITHFFYNSSPAIFYFFRELQVAVNGQVGGLMLSKSKKLILPTIVFSHPIIR